MLTTRLRRRLLRLLAVSVLLGGGCAAYWQLAGWRVERTDDGRLCGIEKDLLQVTGSALKRSSEERLVCQALAESSVNDCPQFARGSVDRCKQVLGTEKIEYRHGGIIGPRIRVLPDDTGPFAMLAASGRYVRARGTTLVHIGLGETVADAPPSVLRVTAGVERCLGLHIGSGKVITAAHCVGNSPSSVTATCPNSKTGVTFSCEVVTGYERIKECRAASAIPNTARDIVLCEPTDGMPSCFGKPAGLQLSPVGSKLWVSGNMDGELRVVPATVDSPWPTPGLPGIVRAPLDSKHGEIDPGDSGGPVFDGAPDRAVGISVCQGNTAYVVPLYVWKDKLLEGLN